MNAGYAELLDALRGAPALPGAACRGRSAEFDTVDTNQAQAAIEVCESCPALHRCRQWADSQPVNALHGVVGGRVYEWASWVRRKPAVNA